MEDIAFPSWVVNGPAMAVATSLSRHLHNVFDQAARRHAEEADKLINVQRELVDADAVHREAAEQNDLGSTESDTDAAPVHGEAAADLAETDSVASQDSDASRVDAVSRARFLFGAQSTGARRYTRLLTHGYGAATASAPHGVAELGAAGTSRTAAPPRPGPCADLLEDARVQLLLRLSRFNDIATGADVLVSPSHATALVALLGCAVNCTALPEDFTRGFFMECSSLYTALIPRLPTLHYTPSVDVQGFVASVVACGMKLRAILESGSDTAGYGAESAALHTSSGLSTPRTNGLSGHGQSLTLSGFSARIVDPALVACIPEGIDDCVYNPIALGALEGLAYTYSRLPVCFAPELVAHLNNLTDAFALSDNRRELAYKKLLSILLEAMSCSKVIDHERTNNWVTAIIQEDYVVRGLFQREILHARVVAATLTLLIRQYQELAHECADQAGGVDGVPDFTEGDQLIELVWRVLQDGLSAWDGAHSTSMTLYGANVRVVLENLLLVEAERVRCYLVITSAIQAHQQRMLAENSMLSFPSTAVVAGVLSPGAKGHAKTVARPPYTPSVQEERLRVRIAGNVVKFLLMPTSVINLPNTGSSDAASSLQRSLTELCARLLRMLCTDHVTLGKPGQSVPTAAAAIFAETVGTGAADGAVKDATGPQPHEASAENDTVAVVRFSNGYYNQVEQVVRTLIKTVMEGPAATQAPSSSSSPMSSPRRARQGGLVLAATVCLQGFCASDAHIGGFVVSEVMDAIQAMLRDMTAHTEMPNEETAARLSLCVDTLRSVLVPGGEVRDSVLDMTALRRYCQLLSDTYENLLRVELMENKRVKERMQQGTVADLLPTMNMSVVADAYWRLTVSLHERLLTLSTDALQVTTDRAVKAQYLRQINEEGEAVRVLLTEAMQCLLRVAWPGSGVLYQQAGKGGVKVPGAPSAKPASLAPFALAVMSPFFRVIGLLLHLATLFPVKRLRSLVAHVEMGPGLLVEDQIDNAMLGYFFQPSKLRTAFHSRAGMAQFRTFWLLLAHYGFTTEALVWSSQSIKLSLASATSAHDAQHATSPLLTATQAEQIRQLAASATPLLFMQSSDLTQALADVNVLVRYTDETTHAAAEDGALWRALTSHQKCLCGRGKSGDPNPWKALTVGELVLLRALAHLELLRGLTGSIANLTTYQHFEIREFVASQAMQPALTLVMASVCTCYVATLRAFSPLTTYSLISRDLLQLVLLVGFAIDSERAGAAMILDMIVCTFPALSVYGHALPLLWSILNVVQSGTAAQLESFCRHVHYDGTPAVDPDKESTARVSLVQQLATMATKWADKALDAAPLALFNLATGFVLQQSLAKEDMSDATRRIGSSLAMQAAQPRDVRRQRADPVLAASAASSTSPVQAIGSASIPSYAQVLIRRSQAQGQVMAAVRFSSLSGVERLVSGQLRRTLAGERHALPCTNFDLLVTHMARIIRAARHPTRGGRGGALAVVGAGSAGPTSPASAHTTGGGGKSGKMRESGYAQIESMLSSAAAVLCTGLCSPSAQWQLLHLVVHSPVRFLDSDVIDAAAGAWSWILAADGGSLALALLRMLCHSIEWTMTHGLGLFDGDTTSQNQVVQTGDSTAQKAVAARYAADYNTRSPHSLLFAFLADNYADPTNPMSQNVVVLQTLHGFCLRLVERVERLSLKDSSFAETMRAMVLVGQVARNVHAMNHRRQRQGLALAVPFASLGVLRHRWYAAVLHWFRKLPPSWYFAADPSLATQELAVLEALVRLIRDEERAVGRSATGFLDFSMPVRYDTTSRGSADAEDDGGSDAGQPDTAQPPHRPHRRQRESQSPAVYKVTPASMIWTIASAVRDRTAKILDVSQPEVALRQLMADEQKRVGKLLQLLRVLVQHECVRIRVWQTPRRTLQIDACVPVTDWRDHLEVAAVHDPAVVVAMARRFDSIAEVRDAAVSLVGKSPELYVTIPEAVDLYLTVEVLAAGAPKLFLFHDCTITQGLRFLDERFTKYPEVGKYAIRSLLSCESEYLIFYLPQLLQVLATDTTGAIQNFLQRMAAKSVVFCHQLLWSLQTEGEGETELARRCRAVADQIKKGMSPEAKRFYEDEFAFTALVTSLSGELMKFDKPQRKPTLRKRLVDAEFHVAPRSQHVYLATDPHYRIIEVIPHTAGAMQSAAKCPILVQFQCVARDLSDMRLPAAAADDKTDTRDDKKGDDAAAGGALATVLPRPDPRDVVVKACIFKMGDDCRQDQISLQLIGLMQRIFDAIDVPSYLYPYRVVTTGQDSGIIEVVPNSVSRNEIGKLVESNLAEYFVQTFGHPESVRFKRARHEFIKSTAAYSIASFILNIKDRHNGNIMIDQKGHLVHIDFGFLFDTSPGGDINFESSPFKLTTEMVQLIGKDVGVSNLRSKSLTKALVDEESYIAFKTLVIRCYLAVRQYAREICILVELMLRSGLPCFKPKQTIANLSKRLAMDMTEIEAAHFMRRRIHEARENYRTRLYDWYQNKFEGIEK